MAKLGVCIEPIALLRDRGRVAEADPVLAAVLADLGGADLIVCPLREGLHPLTDRDVKLVRTMVKLPVELQFYPSDTLVGFAPTVSPEWITLVPVRPSDNPDAPRPEGSGFLEDVGKAVRELRSADRRVGLRIEPEIGQVKTAASMGVDYVKFRMGHGSEARGLSERAEALESVASLILAAGKMGLAVALEGDVDYHNAAEYSGLGKIHHIVAGGAIAGRALAVGMEQAVRDMAGLVH
jgi:pyridoxine 5-phosphate synthase